MTDSYNEVKVVENKKIVQEIEEEERKEKELERLKREQEDEERKRLKHQEKLKKLEKRNKERTPTSSEKEIVNNAKSDAIKNIYTPPNYPPVDPTASVPIGIYQKQRDIDLVEPEEKVKKTKKTKEKAVLSLGEFNGDTQGDFPEAYGDHQVYRVCRDLMLIFFLKERLARLACIKRTVEDQNPTPPYYSVPRTDVNQVNLKVFAITFCFSKSDPCCYFLSPSIKDITFFSWYGYNLIAFVLF